MLRSIGSVTFLALLMVACGGGGSGGDGSQSGVGGDGSQSGVKIGGGSVSGLMGSGLVLQLRAPNLDGNRGSFAVSDPLQINSNGPFAFNLINPTLYRQIQQYVFIRVIQQPVSPTQSCMVEDTANGAASADVACSQFAYVANAGDNTVSAYTVDATTGALTALPGFPVGAGTSPLAIVGTDHRRYVFVGNEGSNDISGFAVNFVSGALTPVPGSPFAAGTDPQGMALYGSTLYVANAGSDNVSAYSIDDGTGALAPLFGPAASTIATGKNPTSIAIPGPNNLFVYVANHGGSNDISAFSSFDLTPVPGSPFPAGGNPLSLAVGTGATGKFLYTANPDATNPSISGFSVDLGSGVLTPLSGSPFPLAVSHDIATDRTGAYLYVTSGASIVGYAIDATTGALTALPGFPVNAGANAYSVSIDSTNQFLYVTNDGAANITGFRLDASTGALTPMADSPFPAGSHPHFIATF